MENPAPLVVGEDTFNFAASQGIEACAHRVIFNLMRNTGQGRLRFLTDEVDQKAGRDYLYRIPEAGGSTRDISFECKAELYPLNHFYELVLFYLSANGTGTYEYGNAQKTTAHLMAYVNYAAGYVVIAQRVTWLHIAQQLVLDALLGSNGAEAVAPFAALNGRRRLELAAVGLPFAHAKVVREMLRQAKLRGWSHCPVAVFDLREGFAEGWANAATADQAMRQHAQTLMSLKYPSYTASGREADMARVVNDFMGLMKRGLADYRGMNNALSSVGGIRPAAELATWVEALPAFSARHEQPIQRFGTELMDLVSRASIVTNQAQTLVDNFNRTVFVPRSGASSQYFHDAEKPSDVAPASFMMRRK